MAENRSRSSEDRPWGFPKAAFASWVVAAVVALFTASPALAQQGGGAGGPTYQRKGSFADHGKGHRGDWRRHDMRQFSSSTSAGSFQRPYPFHLDYYRAKWGGSYAPYFGNLYGPPNYFINGAPWFGGFGGVGFSGFNSGFGEFGGPGFGGPGFEGGPFRGGVPFGPWAGEFAVPPVDGAAMEGPAPF